MNPKITKAWQRQDLFALMICRTFEGTFADLGAHDPFMGNNTAWLEYLGWTGHAVDRQVLDGWVDRKGCYFVGADATKVRFPRFEKIDFLSVDVDGDSAKAVKNFLFEQRCLPTVITIEHDLYSRGPELRDEQRKFLSEWYDLIHADVCVDVAGIKSPFEDWWVDKSYSHRASFRTENAWWHEIVSRIA